MLTTRKPSAELIVPQVAAATKSFTCCFNAAVETMVQKHKAPAHLERARTVPALIQARPQSQSVGVI